MEMLLSYTSNSSDGSDNESTYPLPVDLISEQTEQINTSLEASKIQTNASDYFGLESNSEEEDNLSVLNQNAAQLSDIPFGPKLCNSDSKISSCSSAEVEHIERGQVSDVLPTNVDLNFSHLKRHRDEEPSSNKRKVIVQNDKSDDINLFGNGLTSDLSKPAKTCIFNLNSNSETVDNIKTSQPLFARHEKVVGYTNKDVHSKPPREKFKTFDGHDSCISSLKWDISQYSHLFFTTSLDCKLKVWNYFLGQCVKEIKYSSGIRSAVWSLCGTKVVCGGYGKQVHLTDVNSGIDVFTQIHPDNISSVQIHPEMQHVILSGTKHYAAAWDVRDSSKTPIRKFTSRCGQVLDIIFNQEGQEIIYSSEIVSRDSADRTLMVWDFNTGALLSNQVFQERYTCPCIKLQPGGKNFIAQTNGSYIAIFSTTRPYKLNKKKRYEGHKVAGYGIECDFSPDGSYIVSGDAEGRLFFYKTYDAQIAKSFVVRSNSPTLRVAWHPLFYSTVAVGTWNGDVYIWQ